MNDNIIYIPSKISKIKLREVLETVYADYNNKKLDLDGMTITIKKLPEEFHPEISLSGKNMTIKLPVCFSLYKSAGLFSLEGEGCILMDFEVKVDILQNLELNTQTTWISHQWRQGPLVHIGELTLPAETISNCLIHYLKEDVATKIDQKIAENIQLKKMVEAQLHQLASNVKIYDKPTLFFNGRIINIFVGQPSDSASNIDVDIWMELLAKVSDEPVNYNFQSQLNLFWSELPLKSNNQSIEVEISYLGLSRFLASEINGKVIGGKKFEVESIHIRNTQNLEIKVHLTSPIKGILTIDSKPRFEVNNQELDLEDLKVDVNAENLIYKMASPIIENIVKSRIEEQLPFPISPFLQSMLQKLPEIKLLENTVKIVPSFEQPKINAFTLGQHSAQIKVLLQNPEVTVEMA